MRPRSGAIRRRLTRFSSACRVVLLRLDDLQVVHAARPARQQQCLAAGDQCGAAGEEASPGLLLRMHLEASQDGALQQAEDEGHGRIETEAEQVAEQRRRRIDSPRVSRQAASQATRVAAAATIM